MFGKVYCEFEQNHKKNVVGLPVKCEEIKPVYFLRIT